MEYTSRMWHLHDLLINGATYSTQQIKELLPFDYGDYDTSKSDNDNSTTLRTELLKMNESTSSRKTLIYKLIDGIYYFRFAQNKEEAMAFAKEVYEERALKSLTRYYSILRRIRNDGQGQLLSTRLDPITDECKAKEFIESFVKEVVENDTEQEHNETTPIMEERGKVEEKKVDFDNEGTVEWETDIFGNKYRVN